MKTLGSLSQTALHYGLSRMNKRVLFAAVLGIFLFLSLFWFAPINLMTSPSFLIGLSVLFEVTLVSILLTQYGQLILKSPWGAKGWRCVFGFHSTLYAASWGISCAKLLVDLGITTYSISVTTTALAACTVAVSTISFDLLACLAFLSSLLIPILYVSLFVLADGQGLAGACTLSITFFMYLARSIQKAEIDVFLHEDTIRSQAHELLQKNSALEASNNLVKDTLDSIDEVFLVIDLNGFCVESPSDRARSILGRDPKGMHFSKILDLNAEDTESSKAWLGLLETTQLDFEIISQSGPAQWIDSAKDLTYRVRYFPMRTKGQPTAIIMTLLDVTSNLHSEKAAEDAETRSRFIMAVSENRLAFGEFLLETEARLKALQTWDGQNATALRNDLHNMKGLSGLFYFIILAQLINELELKIQNVDELSLTKILRKSAKTILGELQNWMQTEAATLQRLRVFAQDEMTVPESRISLVNLSYSRDPKKLAIVEQAVTRMKAESLHEALAAYIPHVEKISQRLHKEVRLKLEATDQDCYLLTKEYSEILQIMIHLFNNAVDHGIELAEKRLQLGKSPQGQILVTFQCSDQNLVIRVSDDGGGIDVLKLGQLLIQRGVDIQNWSTSQILLTIFDQGISTKSEATDISGQGVGLNSLYEHVKACGGDIEVTTRLDQGTTFTLSLPANEDTIWVAPTLKPSAIAAKSAS